MTDPATEWEGQKIQSSLERLGIECDRGVAQRLARDRFRREWIPDLMHRARSWPGAKAPTQLVQKWIANGKWAEQMLFLLFEQAGLWGGISHADRWAKAKTFDAAGLAPWTLEAMWRAALREETIRDAPAYVAKILTDSAWAPFVERVEKMERARHVTAEAVVSLVQGVLREIDQRTRAASLEDDNRNRSRGGNQ